MIYLAGSNLQTNTNVLIVLKGLISTSQLSIKQHIIVIIIIIDWCYWILLLEPTYYCY